MQKAKRKIGLKVLAGLLGLWLAFFSIFTVWEVHSTRENLLSQVYQNMEQLRSNIERIYLNHWNDRVHTGLSLEVQPKDEIRAKVAEYLVGYKALGEMELACYDERMELLGSSGAYMALSYQVEPDGKRALGESFYGLLDIDRALPEEAAQQVKFYATFSPGEYSDEPGYLNGYTIMVVGLWSDGLNLIPRKVIVMEQRVLENGDTFTHMPEFDEDGNMTEAGNQKIVWEYINEPKEELIGDMVFCPGMAYDYGIGRPALAETYPEFLETVLDVQKVRQDYGEGLMEQPGYVEILGNGQMVAQGNAFVTEYYGYWRDATLYSFRQSNYSEIMDMGGIYDAPVLTAAGRIYPLKECAGTLATVGVGSLLLFLMVAAILIWQLTKVYEKQAELEAQRRRTTNAMAHDLKTPMAAITGYAENLLENTHPEKQEKYLRSIYGQVGRMNETVGKMLELSRLEAEADQLSLETFSMAELCREAIADYVGDQVRFQIAGDAKITADRAMIRRVLDNLLSNAKKHTAPGGTIEVTVEQGRCTVFNPGEQIPPEQLSKLWEAYYQADSSRSQGGSGLGLSIVREILTRHGFEYGAENREAGVEFWFAF